MFCVTAHGTTDKSSTYRLESVDNDGAYLDILYYAQNASNGAYVSTLSNPSPISAISSSGLVMDVDVTSYYSSSYYLCEQFNYYKNNGKTLLASEGSTLNFDLNGFNHKGILSTNTNSSGMTNSSTFNFSRIAYVYAFLLDSNGNTIKSYDLTNSIFSYNSDDTYNFSFKLTDVPADVYTIGFEFRYKFSDVFTNLSHNQIVSSPYKVVSIGYNSMLNSSINFSVEDGSTGLLKGIINIVTNIKDGVSNLISGITELPSKLWNLIENGLKGLFVPTESQMTDIKVQWDNLLSDRFGGLYQTVQLIDDYAGTFKEPSQSQSSIDFPEFRLNVGSDSEFVLQAHDVQIVPERFSFLVDVVKTIISIIATCLFVNGLRNKFERLVGGHE